MRSPQPQQRGVFIYIGGRAAPFVPFAIVHPSVRSISAYAFERNENLLGVQFHNFIETVESHAFALCGSIRRMVMLHVKNVEYSAFYACWDLEIVEFGRDLETIGESAFDQCTSLAFLKMPCVRRIGRRAFQECVITELDLPLEIEVVEGFAFAGCQNLERLSMPLKEGLIEGRAFVSCSRLDRVDLIGGVHDFVLSLHLEEWRNEATVEIDRINEVLPLSGERADKTVAIREWIQSVIDRMNYYKREHYAVLKEGMTILELAIWRVKIMEAENERDNDNSTLATNSSASLEGNLSQKLKIDNNDERIFRQVQRGKCCSDIVIRNVLPYLVCKQLD